MRTTLRLVFAALSTALLASLPAHAQLFRAYLAIDGSDANPCTLPAPCRLLPAALAAVASGGEIWLLDSANYNTATVNINKSVTILAVPGVVGSVVSVSGRAIDITTPSLQVTLRNLVIVPLPGTGGEGVVMSANSLLSVENSVIANFVPFSALHVLGAGKVLITDSVFRNNGLGVYLEDGTRAQIAGTRLLGNTTGLLVSSRIASDTRATISDCIISGDTGLWSYSDIAGGSAAISVSRSTIGNATYALRADSSNSGGAEVIIGSSQVHNSTYRWYKTGGASSIASFGNNQMVDYQTQLGTLTTITLE